MTELPCGCLFGESTDSNGDYVFVYEPCSLDCEYYKYVQEEAARQQKELTTIDITGNAECPSCGAYLSRTLGLHHEQCAVDGV